MVAELGYSVTKVAHGLPSALNEISKENFDGVLVNIGIDDQKHGNDIADILLAKNIPFAFVTGYGHAFEQRHANIPLLQKPFTSEQLRVLLGAIVGPGGVRTIAPRTRPSASRASPAQPSPRARNS